MSPRALQSLEPASTDPAFIRNFCIIAHIDHGKSTLADRMLGITGVVSDRDMRAQYLDRMDIERERGITIKSQAVRMPWRLDKPGNPLNGTYALNMIDTPGHVDFTYEVSRSLAACEGAILLVDAAQGIEAQTLANLYLALENDLTIIPVLNKIDLPAADPDKYSKELASLIGGSPEDVLRVSGKTGQGVEELLDRVVELIPAPVGDPDAPSRAMIFDSVYDSYRGVITYVRMIDGRLSPRERIQMMSTRAVHELLEIGVSAPEPIPTKGLAVGEVGYLITGVKDVRQSKVGDTVTSAQRPSTNPLPGYTDPKPMVFSGVYPIDGSDYPVLREALDKLKLSDAALVYEPETSVALGFGFRCGFLGLLHLEIVTERLEREFGLDLISTAPSVTYEVTTEDKKRYTVTNPSEFPSGTKIAHVTEPMVKAAILAPKDYVGTIMELCQSRRGALIGMDYLGEDRVEITYTMPLGEIVFDFFDQLKIEDRRLRLPRLRARGRAGGRPRQGRHPAAGRGRRRLQRDRAPRQGLRLRHAHGRAAQEAHPAPAVRGADPGGDRGAHHRARDDHGDAQGRARQVLRRRHHPQAQAPREAEGGQEADEDGRSRRGAPGGVHRGPVRRHGSEEGQEVAASSRRPLWLWSNRLQVQRRL